MNAFVQVVIEKLMEVILTTGCCHGSHGCRHYTKRNNTFQLYGNEKILSLLKKIFV